MSAAIDKNRSGTLLSPGSIPIFIPRPVMSCMIHFDHMGGGMAIRSVVSCYMQILYPISRTRGAGRSEGFLFVGGRVYFPHARGGSSMQVPGVYPHIPGQAVCREVRHIPHRENNRNL